MVLRVGYEHSTYSMMENGKPRITAVMFVNVFFDKFEESIRKRRMLQNLKQDLPSLLLLLNFSVMLSLYFMEFHVIISLMLNLQVSDHA